MTLCDNGWLSFDVRGFHHHPVTASRHIVSS
jgi:hypothetical protein